MLTPLVLRAYGRGYGYAWYRSSYKQWGLAMQDDVTDALKFAVSKGYVDPARVCIAGASYGGDQLGEFLFVAPLDRKSTRLNSSH